MTEQIKEITADEVLEKLKNGEKLNLVDIREDEEVSFGMIPEAKHLRMGDIPENMDFFNKEDEYILVCRSGNRSFHACHFLQAQGYKVINMAGGMLDWTGETEPNEK
jgi:rhodanese-related sulfurtransferase